MSQLYGIFIVLVACLIGSVGPIFLKKGTKTLAFNIKSIIYNKNLILGVFFYGISALMFIYALQFGEVSVLYPFAATSYIWISFLSVKYLGEKMNKRRWMGIALIIIGVSLIGFA